MATLEYETQSDKSDRPPRSGRNTLQGIVVNVLSLSQCTLRPDGQSPFSRGFLQTVYTLEACQLSPFHSSTRSLGDLDYPWSLVGRLEQP